MFRLLDMEDSSFGAVALTGKDAAKRVGCFA
jgi:hypothetical protein